MQTRLKIHFSIQVLFLRPEVSLGFTYPVISRALYSNVFPPYIDYCVLAGCLEVIFPFQKDKDEQ